MLIKLIALLSTGFLLGVQHSLDADHVAAVSTIVSKSRSLKKSALIGAIWGVGHTATILLVGIIVLVLKVSIPELVAQSFEFLVGVMLIYLGLALLKSVFINKVHVHRHSHGEIEHTHLHSHKAGPDHLHVHKPFMIGMIHGLAGSAGIMLLILATMDSVVQGLFFTLTFGLGSVLGMIATGTLIGLPFLLTAKHNQINLVFMTFVAFVSIAIGLNVLKDNWMF